LAEQLTASQAGLIAAAEPTIEKALDKALTTADKMVKRTVDATTDEITSELKRSKVRERRGRPARGLLSVNVGVTWRPPRVQRPEPAG
jgi:hypothetical protein